jgi:hypothetical protein
VFKGKGKGGGKGGKKGMTGKRDPTGAHRMPKRRATDKGMAEGIGSTAGGAPVEPDVHSE